MVQVGAFEAKTHLTELLKRVEGGESVQITRRGVPIARLVPVEASSAADLKDVVRQMRESRRGLRLNGLKIKEMLHEGHRY